MEMNNGRAISEANPLPVTQSTALNATFDSVDVKLMSKGSTTTPLNAITATTTSTPIDMTKHRHVSVEITVSAFTAGNFVVDLLGASIISGTYGTLHKLKDDGTFAQLKTPTISANGTYTYEFTNIGARYIELRATRTTDGTLTAKVTPYN
jgi:hypothetical protein